MEVTAQFHAPAALPPERASQPIGWQVGWAQDRSEHWGYENNFCLCWELNPHSLFKTACKQSLYWLSYPGLLRREVPLSNISNWVCVHRKQVTRNSRIALLPFILRILWNTETRALRGQDAKLSHVKESGIYSNHCALKDECQLGNISQVKLMSRGHCISFGHSRSESASLVSAVYVTTGWDVTSTRLVSVHMEIRSLGLC